MCRPSSVRHYSPSPGRSRLNVELERSARRIELRSERLSIELDPTSLELSVASRDGAPRLSGARPRAWLDGRARSALRAQSVESERVDTPLGPATRVLVCCDAGEGLQLGLSLDVGGDWPGLVLQLALQNGGAARARLDALDTLAWRDAHGELELPGGRELCWFDPGEHGAARASARPLRRSLRAACAASLGARGRAGLTLGFLGWRVHAGWIALDARAGAPVELCARSESGFALEPGERALGERLWLGVDAADADGLALWAERVALELEVRLRRPLSVWCTGPAASAGRALELARALRERELPVDAIRIDGGFAERAGDWLEPTPRFPAGLAPVARELRALGFALGLRLSPFAVAKRSEPARIQRDWLLPGSLRSAAGRVRVLDLAREPVLGWLESLARALVERGAEHLWFDELWLGLLPADRPRRAQLYRAALEALRRGAGPGAFLAGLAAPFAASAGLLDALQIAPGTASPARWWRRRTAPDDPSLRIGLAGRLAIGEPGEVRLGDEDPAGLRRSAIHAAICGGNVALRGLPETANPRWRLARRLLPPSGLAARRLTSRAGAVLAETSDGSRLLALFAPGGEALDLSFATGEAARVFDAWRGLDLGAHPGPLAWSALEAGDAQLLRISPADGQARLIGSTLHLSAGAAELRGCRAAEAGGVRLELALSGPRRGSLHVQCPGAGSDPVRARVAFEDTLALELGGGAIHPVR